MASFYSSSPTVVLPPAQDQYFGQTRMNQSPTDVANAYFNRSTPSPKSSSSILGRKRSRDEDDDQEQTLVAQEQPSLAYRGEPVYGPGMTLVYPNDPSGHYNIDVGSQTGTWVDNTWVQQQAAAAAAQPQKPAMTSRKSQRLDSAFSPSNTIDIMAESTPRRTTSSEPLIDEVTRLLGISWMRMDATEALQISQKAYTRWITRHYPGLTDVELWFENSSIPGYLGVATNKSFGTKEYLLWSNDLKQAVLVTRQPSEIITKLMSPQAILSNATESIFASDEAVVDDASSDRGNSPIRTFATPVAIPQTAAAMEVD